MGGDHGIVLKTTNAGDNWTIQQTSLNEFIYGIAFTSPVEGLACSWSGKILKTTNGGVVTSISDPLIIPEGYSLRQNYPNPYNPSTDIEFSILKNEYVKLVVYDYLGREVKTLVSEQLSPGSYSVSFDGENLSSGVYYYKLTAGSFTETKKMTLLK